MPDIEIGFGRLPKEAFILPQPIALRPGDDDISRGDAVPFRLSELRKLVTGRENKMFALDRRSIPGQRNVRTGGAFHIDNLDRRVDFCSLRNGAPEIPARQAAWIEGKIVERSKRSGPSDAIALFQLFSAHQLTFEAGRATRFQLRIQPVRIEDIPGKIKIVAADHIAIDAEGPGSG